MEGTIGLFVNSVVGYQGEVVAEVREAAAREGLEVIVFDADHNAAQQAQDVVRFSYQTAGARRCVFVIPQADALGDRLLQDDPTYHRAQRMLQKDVGWIMLNHGQTDFVSALRQEFPRLPVALVAIDNLAFGRVQGRQVKALLPKGGTVVCVRGHPLDSASIDRTQGLRAEIGDQGYTLFELDGRWDEGIAETVLRNWLTSPLRRSTPLHLVIGQNDYMARVARRVLADLADTLARPELKTLPVLGGDGLPTVGRTWVDEDILTATVTVTLPGRAAVEQLAGFWRDGTPIPAVTQLDVSSYPGLDVLERRQAQAR